MEAGHERAAGEWQIEWHQLPQVAVLTAGCLLIAGRTVRQLNVDPERMAANLAAEQGRTLAEAYMFELAPELGREVAHDYVYEAATRSKAEGLELREVLEEMAGAEHAVREIRPSDYTGQAREDALRAVRAWRHDRG
jgi:3-carboxy-cis,cis-muconate cycloisomerase